MKQVMTLSKNIAILVAILIITLNTKANSNTPTLLDVPSYSFTSTQSIVKYISFNGNLVNNTVCLSWVTSQELNNNYFEIERSFNGKDFSTVGLALDGFENDANKEYAFKDNSKLLENKEVVYYRLKQYDNDGKFNFGSLLALNLKSNNKGSIQLSPNPFVDNFSVKFVGVENATAEILIANALGKSVLNKRVGVMKGYNNIQVDGLSSLPSGTYLATVVVNGKVVGSQKIAK